MGALPKLPPQPHVLVIAMRRLGDVLLTTPLVRSLRRGLPGARVTMLVFRGTEGILAGNPDIDAVITVPERPSAAEMLTLIRTLWRRYDLAVSTQTGDRPTFLAFVAGRRRAGLTPARAGWWKRLVLNHPVTVDSNNHRVVELLRLARAVGVPSQPDLVPPAGAAAEIFALQKPYAVLHPNPNYHYKRWNDAGWRSLACSLAERGLAVFVTGGPDPAERSYLDALWGPADSSVERLDGQLEWPQLAALIGGAQVYIGPDTSMTHLAAATGCPTVAIYGPTSPHLIGPWPVGGPGEPWLPASTIQHRGNVWVVQNPLPCLPCEKLGCEGHYESRSQCLDELSARQVLIAVEEALRARVTASTAAHDPGAGARP